MIKRRVLVLTVILYMAAILLMAACAPLERRTLPPASGVYSDNTYLCKNGREFTVHFSRDGEKAVLLSGGTSRTLLRPAPPPVFTDNVYTLHISENGLLHFDRFGVPIKENCVPLLS